MCHSGQPAGLGVVEDYLNWWGCFLLLHYLRSDQVLQTWTHKAGNYQSRIFQFLCNPPHSIWAILQMSLHHHRLKRYILVRGVSKEGAGGSVSTLGFIADVFVSHWNKNRIFADSFRSIYVLLKSKVISETRYVKISIFFNLKKEKNLRKLFAEIRYS